MKRALRAATITAASVFAMAAAGLADYPPSPSVKGTTITKTDGPGSTAFTGANIMPWLAVALVALLIGAALLYWSRRPARS